MCRKFFTGMALLAVGSYMWFGTSFASYVRTAYGQTKGYILGQVPVEFEIERARNLVAQLKPEVEKAKRTILNEEIKVDRLRGEIAKTADNLAGEKVALLSMREQLGKNLTAYKIGTTTYSPAALERDVSRRFASYRHAEETLKAKEEILSSRESALRSAKEKHDRLLDSRQQLEAKLAALEARQKMIEVKKLASHLTIDDTQVAEVTKLMDEINDRLEVETKIAEEDGLPLSETVTEKLPPADLGKQIDQYFGKPTAAPGSAL